MYKVTKPKVDESQVEKKVEKPVGINTNLNVKKPKPAPSEPPKFPKVAKRPTPSTTTVRTVKKPTVEKEEVKIGREPTDAVEMTETISKGVRPTRKAKKVAVVEEVKEEKVENKEDVVYTLNEEGMNKLVESIVAGLAENFVSKQEVDSTVIQSLQKLATRQVENLQLEDKQSLEESFNDRTVSEILETTPEPTMRKIEEGFGVGLIPDENTGEKKGLFSRLFKR